MTIEAVKQSYQYKYAYLDYKNKSEVFGHIYNVGRVKYFIDNKETYIKPITD